MNDVDVVELKADVREIKSEIKSISGTLIRNTSSLETHMSRTDANEDRIERVENWLVGLLISILIALVSAGLYLATHR